MKHSHLKPIFFLEDATLRVLQTNWDRNMATKLEICTEVWQLVNPAALISTLITKQVLVDCVNGLSKRSRGLNYHFFTIKLLNIYFTSHLIWICLRRLVIFIGQSHFSFFPTFFLLHFICVRQEVILN